MIAIEQLELGKRVKFSHIVNRDLRVRQDLTRWRKGKVIGLRKLYDVEERRDPLPPKNKPSGKIVVVVGVTLYRSYLVEPDDLFEDNGHGSNRTTPKL